MLSGKYFRASNNYRRIRQVEKGKKKVLDEPNSALDSRVELENGRKCNLPDFVNRL